MDRLGLRHSNEAWRRVATELWALHGWSRWARQAARIKVSVATGIFAFQRLVLGAWRLVSQPSQGRFESMASKGRRIAGIRLKRSGDGSTTSGGRCPVPGFAMRFLMTFHCQGS